MQYKEVEMAEEKKNGTELKNVSDLGRIESEVKVSENLKVKLHTLNFGESISLSKDYPVGAKKESDLYQDNLFQLFTLKYATHEVNGKSYSEAERSEVEAFYKSLQTAVVREIFIAYAELIGEQDSVITELKKKLTNPTSEKTI